MALDDGPDTFDTELDALLSQHVTAGQSQGLVYGRVDATGLVRSAGFGVIDDDGNTPDADTVFPIASISKSFVACAAMIAVERGALSLDDPITRFIGEFTGTGTIDDPVDPPTIGMLLSMSGGLTEDNAWVDPFIDMSEQDLLERVARGVRYSHLPGTTFDYSNLGYTLAGLAVGRAIGKSIEDFVASEIFGPLGLASTCFDNAAPADVRRATGYRRTPDGGWQPFPFTQSASFAAAGGIMSTVTDLATWITWLGAAFRPPTDAVAGGSDAVLSRKSRREMQRLRSANIPAVGTVPGGGLQPYLGGYGLGLFVGSDLQRGTVVSHGGGLPGFGLYVIWHPDSGNGLVSLTNSERGNSSGLCTQAFGKVLAKENVPARTITLWPETEDLRGKAEQLIREWDDAAAAELFAENVDFDKPLERRRAEIDDLIADVGPLLESGRVDVVSSWSAADITWSIPAERGELICMIHLTPVQPAQIQEFVVRAVPAGTPRSAAPVDVSGRRAHLSQGFVSPSANTRVVFPSSG